ncbi:MAG: hypothetical protein H0V23_02245 [Nocardioidaceae bacterium]|nr:hypothetical protein [Nocardioidaceae bacterium]
MRDDRVLHVERTLAVLTGLVMTVWGLKCTVVAFSGGTFAIPLITWRTDGDFLLGALWVLYVYPMVTAGACLATMMLTGWLLSTFRWSKRAPGHPAQAAVASVSAAGAQQPLPDVVRSGHS